MIHTVSATSAVPQQDESHDCCAKPQPHERHDGHHAHTGHHGGTHEGALLNRTALMATVHCLIGCTIGEVLGMVLGTILGWGNWETVGLAVVLAFAVGYAMTLWPLRRAGMTWAAALPLAFASDTLSMAMMEFVDNAVMLVIPGAMDAGLLDPLFWGSLGLSLILAGAAAFPVNRWLIARGKGHALVHAQHCH